MKTTELKKAIADRKRESKSMYAEYVAKRYTDKGLADYAWQMMEQLDREAEELESQIANK
jgi:hypothetical protein